MNISSHGRLNNVDVLGGCILGLDSQQSSGFFQNIAYELQGSSTHGAKVVNDDRYQQDFLPFSSRVGNYQLLILGPRKTCESVIGFSPALFLFPRLLCSARSSQLRSSQLANGGAQNIALRQRRIVAIRCEHGVKEIGGA